MYNYIQQSARYYFLLVTIMVCVSSPLWAQNPYWRGGGNLIGGADQINLGLSATGLPRNYFGTTGLNPNAIQIGTNGTRRMLVTDGGSGSTQGYVGIGNNAGTGFGFWQPTQRLHLHDQGSPPVGGVFAKWTNKNNLSKIS